MHMGICMSSACMRTRLHECLHIYQHTCLHTCLHKCLQTCLRTHVLVRACIYTRAFIHACTHACKHIYAHVCTHACTYVYTRPYTCLCSLQCGVAGCVWREDVRCEMQSSRASAGGSGKVAGTRPHTLLTPEVHLPEANPALVCGVTKDFRVVASTRGIFIERDREPQTYS